MLWLADHLSPGFADALAGGVDRELASIFEKKPGVVIVGDERCWGVPERSWIAVHWALAPHSYRPIAGVGTNSLYVRGDVPND